MDFLGLLEKECHFDLKKLKDPEDVYKAYKFEQLVKQINRAKES